MQIERFQHLAPGHDYVVTRAFADHDGDVHAVGERWTYRGKSFLPYEDGLSLFVVIGGVDHQIRMQWRAEEQGPIIDALTDYLAPA